MFMLWFVHRLVVAETVILWIRFVFPEWVELTR